MSGSRRKMRSIEIVSFRCDYDQVEDTTQVTGSITVTTRTNNEITIFQANIPMAKTAFDAKFAAVETALNESWFELPSDIEYRG